MKLRHIKGGTYAIENENACAGFSDSASSGLYVFADGRCLLIDSGANPAQAQGILALMEASGWSVYAIFNTHAHADHCGGNRFIQEKSSCRIYASAIEAAFINHPVLTPYTMFSACPPKLLTGKFFMPQASRVSHIILPGKLQVNRKRFTIFDLAGHSPGHLGIMTPDQVLFAGDSLISREILDANPFLYLADSGQQLESLARLKDARCDQLYLAHGGLMEDIAGVMKANETIFQTMVDNIKAMIAVPRSREAIIQEIAAWHGLQVNRNHYFRLGNSIAAFLSFLCNRGQAKFYMEGNLLLYQVQDKGEGRVFCKQLGPN
ncbi:MAG: MBL fold metallo-hydrolase [Syntrophomonadaceae bacterium]|nr:MBL fold metallo-hydrolase [Syntrophomonadaceae bacterium]